MHFNNAFQSMSHDLMMTCWTYLIIIMILIHYEFTNYDELWWIINYDELFTVRIPKSSRSEHRHHSGREPAPVWKTEAAPGAVGGGGDVPSAKGHAMKLKHHCITKVTMMSSKVTRMSLGCHQKMRPSGSAVNEVRCLNPRLGSHLPMQLRELRWIVQTYVEDPRIAPTRRYRRVIWFEVLRLLAQPSTEVYLWKTRIQTFNALHQKTCSMSFSSLFWIYRACARMLSSWKQTQLARISMPV